MNSAEILRRRFLQALGLTSLGVAVGAFVAATRFRTLTQA